MVATTWRDTSIRPRSLAWISVLGGFPVRDGLAFVFESILVVVAGSPACRVLLCDADFASIIRDGLRGAEENQHHGTTLRDLRKGAPIRAPREPLEGAHEASLHAQSAQSPSDDRRPHPEGPGLHPLSSHPAQVGLVPSGPPAVSGFSGPSSCSNCQDAKTAAAPSHQARGCRGAWHQIPPRRRVSPGAP